MKSLAIARSGLMTMGEAARRCGISRQSFRVHFLEGRIPAADRVGRWTLFSEQDVDAFREWHSQHPAVQVAKRAKRTA